MSKKEVVKEQDLKAILDKISDDNRTEGLLLVNELSFIIKTLDKLKAIIDTNGVIEDFKQGKQEFKRESTALKSYNATMKTYNTTFSNLLKLVDASNTPKKEVKGDFMLDLEFDYLSNPKYLKMYAEKHNIASYHTIDETDDDYIKFVLPFFNKENNTNIELDDVKLEKYIND